MFFVIVIVLVHGSLMVHAVGLLLLLLLLVRSINRINAGLDCRSLPIVPILCYEFYWTDSRFIG